MIERHSRCRLIYLLPLGKNWFNCSSSARSLFNCFPRLFMFSPYGTPLLLLGLLRRALVVRPPLSFLSGSLREACAHHQQLVKSSPAYSSLAQEGRSVPPFRRDRCVFLRHHQRGSGRKEEGTRLCFRPLTSFLGLSLVRLLSLSPLPSQRPGRNERPPTNDVRRRARRF